MDTYKPLLPRYDSAVESSSSQSSLSPPLPSSKRSTVSAACGNCHARKVKCDGVRPTCRPCRMRGWDCAYEVEAGLTRRQGVKRKHEELQQNVESFSVLYKFLQHGNSAEALALLQRIRGGTSLEDALDYVKGQSPKSPSTPEVDPGTAWAQQMHYSNLLLEDELLSAASSTTTMMGLRDGVDCFFQYLGTMFPIFTREEVDNHILPTFLGPPHEKSEATARQIADKRVACGELLAMCAVGLQYNRQSLPSGDASICTPFYQKARLFLDYVMEQDVLRAMRILCCLGMYNTIAKSALAVTYTDWGICLASSKGLGGGKKPIGMSDEDFTKYSKVFKALVTVRSWVTATLGHIPSPEVARFINETRAELLNGLFDCTAQGNVVDVLQQNMTMITILKANILRTAACFRSLSPDTVTQMRRDIEKWYDGLPAYMSLESLTSNPTISDDQRRVTFYMHLFYMSAIMLKARAVLADEDAPQAYWSTKEVRRAVSEGVEASRSSARLLKLLYDERSVVRNCWLTIYQSYITCLLLNYSSVTNYLQGVNIPEGKRDTDLGRICVKILALCATMDPIGKKFHQRCQQVQDIVDRSLAKASAKAIGPVPSCTDAYCKDSHCPIPQQGATKLHDLQDDLRKMCCYPLASHRGKKNGRMPPIPVAEVIVNGDFDFAHHLASPFNTDGEVEPASLFPPDDFLAGKYSSGQAQEGFMSGSVPYSWSKSVWAGKHTADACGEIADRAAS